MPLHPAVTRAETAPVIRVTAVVLRDGDAIALVRKRGTAAWIFPGGKPEAGESAAVTGARELGEELGLVVDAGSLVDLGRHETAAANEAGHRLVADVVAVPGGLGALGVGRADVRPAAEIAELLWHPVTADRADLAPLTRLVLATLR